ncbi:MAG TPA: potassium-transporting ATPase subunit KdpC [Streptosporangiaceae bacterium]|nr:potassium-transporting ATPase subunit KdpC [Streptosporangiaceae bacterium]
MSRLPSWLGQHLAALRMLIVITVICGVAYPLVVMGVSQAAFHKQANGSLATFHGKVVGSSLLCQEFVDAKGNPLPQYFQERPSNAVNPASKTDYGCDAGFSAASNLGPTNPVLVNLINSRRQAVAKFNGVSPASVPPDAVTASGSGLDPDISPAYAYLQVNRVAAARHLSPATVRALVTKHIQGRNIGFLGEPRVNVLELNLALDNLTG